MRNILGFIVFAAAVVAVLYFFSGREFPPVPDDALHRGVTAEEACMKCHGPDGTSPLKKEHPPKFECFKCHKPAGR
jgi:cytochrome c553